MATVQVWPAIGITVKKEGGIGVFTPGEVVERTTFVQRRLDQFDLYDYDPTGQPYYPFIDEQSVVQGRLATELDTLRGRYEEATTLTIGRSAPNDGNGGNFTWYGSSTTTRNGTSVWGLAATGRWIQSGSSGGGGGSGASFTSSDITFSASGTLDAGSLADSTMVIVAPSSAGLELRAIKKPTGASNINARDFFNNSIYPVTVKHNYTTGTTDVDRINSHTGGDFIWGAGTWLRGGYRYGSTNRWLTKPREENVNGLTPDQFGVLDNVRNDAAWNAWLAAVSASRAKAGYLPAGTYLIGRTSGVDNITADGVIITAAPGANIVFDQTVGATPGTENRNAFQATNRKNLQFYGLGFGAITLLHLTGCSDVVIDGIRGSGRIASGAGVGRDWSYGVHLHACKRVTLSNSVFENWEWGLYLNGSYASRCDKISVSSCHFYKTSQHTIAFGQTGDFPAGIYVYYAGDVSVLNSTFANILSAVSGGNKGTGCGQGIYEGDGACESLTVSGCIFENSAGNAYGMGGIYVTQTKNFDLQPCIFRFNSTNSNSIPICGDAIANDANAPGAQRWKINGGPVNMAGGTNRYACQVGTADASSYALTVKISGIQAHGGRIQWVKNHTRNVALSVVDNESFASPDAGIEVLGAVLNINAKVANNHVEQAKYTGILIAGSLRSQVMNNRVLDCNTADEGADDTKYSGIAFPSFGYGATIKGNHVENRAGTGKMRRAVHASSSTQRFAWKYDESNTSVGFNPGVPTMGDYFYSSAPVGGWDWRPGDVASHAKPIGGGARAWRLEQRIETTLGATLSAGNTSVTVASTAGMAKGDAFQVILSAANLDADAGNPYSHYSGTIESITNGTTLVLTAAVPASFTFASGCPVSVLRWVAGGALAVASVIDYGALGNGATDDSAAFQKALNSGASLVKVPFKSTGYMISSALTVPQGVQLKGEHQVRLIKGFDGDLITLGTKAALTDLYLDGQGATRSGRGVVIGGTDVKQRVRHCTITNFAGYCVEFTAIGAGSACSFIDCEIWRYNAASGTGNYAIKIPDTQQLAAVPRKFIHIEFGGQCSFDFGGCNNTFLTDCYMADVRYTDDSRAVYLKGCRIGNQASLTIKGHNNTIIGCDINPLLTLGPGTDNCVISDNSYNNLPIVDTSGNNRNLISHFNVADAVIYSPEIRGTGNKVWEFNATKSGSGPDVSAWSGGGFPLKIKITTGGARGTAQYQVSHDGGTNYLSTIYTTPSGGTNTVTCGGATATLTWSSGTYVLNETYTWTPPTVIGTYHRHGSQTTVVAEINFGTGAAFTFNAFKMSLPFTRQGTNQIVCSGVQFVDTSTGKLFQGYGVIVGATGELELRCPRMDGSQVAGEMQPVTQAAPFTWAATDAIYVNVTFTN